MNNIGFNFNLCNFANAAMKTKEKGDMYNKEGSSRVYFYKHTGIINSYTVEASAFKSNKLHNGNEDDGKEVNEYSGYIPDIEGISEGAQGNSEDLLKKFNVELRINQSLN